MRRLYLPFQNTNQVRKQQNEQVKPAKNKENDGKNEKCRKDTIGE